MLLMLSRGEAGSRTVVHGVMLAEIRGRRVGTEGARIPAFQGGGLESAACGTE
jgi:hypothetical protein